MSELDEYIEDILLTHLENPRTIQEIRARSAQEDEGVETLDAHIGRWEALAGAKKPPEITVLFESTSTL